MLTAAPLALSGYLSGVLAVLALTMLVTLVRVLRGPTGRDRLLGVALASTTGIGFLLVASVRFAQPSLRDAALATCALAVLVVAVRVRAESAGRDPGEHPGERADG